LSNWQTYSLLRLWQVFSFLLSIFLLIRRKERLLWFKPKEPKELKETILALGASFIKLAQVLATRADFFDDNYLRELKTLHDEIPPMSKDEFEVVFLRAFGDKNPFKSFNQNPIASASIGQVHRAKLKDGRVVAVKLRRLGISSRVKADIKILTFFNRLFSPLFSTYTKNSIDALIAEFSDMTLKEVSLTNELSNLKSFRQTYKNSGVIFPEPFEEYCSDDAIVMSFEEGIRFDDKEGLKRLGIDFNQVIESLIFFYTEQMLIKGYFHADPHPGNLLIKDNGKLVLLDFGMVKRIANPTRVAIIEMVKSAHEQDFDLYISACKRLGIIAYEAPLEQMTELAQRMFDIFNDNNLDAISMQELAFGVMASMRDFPFKLPQEAVYILRASAIIEGLGTIYISNFNGVKDILPVLQSNIPRALGTNKSILELLVSEIHSAPLRAKQLQNSIQKISEDELRVHLNSRQLEWIESKIDRRLRSIAFSILLLLLAPFLILYNPELKEYSLIIFIIGAIRLIYR